MTGMTYQDVQVGKAGFRILSRFTEDIGSGSIDNESGIITYSKTRHDSYNAIRITEMHSGDVYIDADSVNIQIGGDRKNMFGYTGFFRKDSDVYSFSFVKDNTLITVYATDINLFDEIKML